MKNYCYLMRLDKPIGIFLLLWPSLWALWLAGNGRPSWHIVWIFVLGVVLMRSAGCVINDIADRHVDKYVKRTAERPLTANKISLRSAILIFVGLLLSAGGLVLLLNPFTQMLAIIGALLTVVYPFLKRVTHLPQLGLGVAFAWSVPMAFAAEMNHIPSEAWFLFATAILWPIIFDTIYAMVDRQDDIKINVKSSAILFGKYDRWIIGLLQAVFLFLMVSVGYAFHLSWQYKLGLFMAAALFVYQQLLMRDSTKYFAAFLNNQWVGFVIFCGIVASFHS